MNLFWRVLPCERQHFFCFLYFERFRFGVFWVRAGFKWLIICDLSVGVKETLISCIYFCFFVSLQANEKTCIFIVCAVHIGRVSSGQYVRKTK